MLVAVAADLVSPPGDLLHTLGIAACHIGGHKEGCSDLVVIKDIQQAGQAILHSVAAHKKAVTVVNVRLRTEDLDKILRV